MEHIEIYADGKTFGKSGSGFAVVLLSKTNEWKRSFAYGNYTTNVACLLAIKFGLLSIAKPFSHLPVKIFTKNQYVANIFERDENGYYCMVPKANKELVEEIKILMTDNTQVIKDSNDRLEECSELVTSAVKDKNLTDSRR